MTDCALVDYPGSHGRRGLSVRSGSCRRAGNSGSSDNGTGNTDYERSPPGSTISTQPLIGLSRLTQLMLSPVL